MDEGIDESQWLPRGAEVILPERRAKGDLRVHRDPDNNFLSAQLAPDTVLARHIDDGLLPPHYADYADEFHQLRRSFLDRTRYRPASQGSRGYSLGVAASRYLHIRHHLLNDATAEFCLMASDPAWQPDPEPEAPRCRLAFDKLIDAIHEAQKAVTKETIAQDWAAIAAGLRAKRRL